MVLSVVLLVLILVYALLVRPALREDPEIADAETLEKERGYELRNHRRHRTANR